MEGGVGEVSKLFCYLSEKKSTLKERIFAPTFRVVPFSEGTLCAGKQTGNRKQFPPLSKVARSPVQCRTIKHVFLPLTMSGVCLNYILRKRVCS